MIRAAVVTVSDSAVAGTRPDASGPAIRERAESLGWTVNEHTLVPDEPEQIAGRFTPPG